MAIVKGPSFPVSSCCVYRYDPVTLIPGLWPKPYTGRHDKEPRLVEVSRHPDPGGR